MPEMNNTRKLERWSLWEADNIGQLLILTCQMCKVSHCFKPADLMQIFGDVSLYRVVGSFRCELCDRKDYMNIRIHHPRQDDFGKLRVRRLAKIKTVKVPVWEDKIL